MKSVVALEDLKLLENVNSTSARDSDKAALYKNKKRMVQAT